VTVDFHTISSRFPLACFGVGLLVTQISHKIEGRGRGAEGKELVQELSPAPLLPCSPAQARALRDVVRNPGLALAIRFMTWRVGIAAPLKLK